MAFVVKNPTLYAGGATINGEWTSVPPGEFVTSDTKPTSTSYKIKVFEVSSSVVREKKDASVIKSTKVSGGNKNKNKKFLGANRCSGSLTLNSSVGKGFTNSVTLTNGD